MDKTFVVVAGRLDSNGDMVRIEGLNIPKTGVLLTKNFDARQVISKVFPFVADGVLKVTAEVPNELLHAYPAIGFQVVESRENEGRGRTITKSKLLEVSLCAQRNADPDIKTVSEA